MSSIYRISLTDSGKKDIQILRPIVKNPFDTLLDTVATRIIEPIFSFISNSLPLKIISSTIT